ncbi:hypothetical protein N9Q79_02690 [Alphaproteobacteria bacterium]|nr:hypothetical protein [Alphaproteobacteria bacterium]
MLRVVTISLLGLYLTGCASILSDSNQSVSLVTPNCKAAKCTLTNNNGTWYIKETPASAVVQKSFSDLVSTCTKNGKTQTEMHKSKANVATYGNILLGGIPGALIDGGSGKGYDYQSNLINNLSCE